MVQEIWLRWQGAEQSRIDKPLAWLVRVCSNACLDVLKSTRNRQELYPGQWLPEPWLSQSNPESDWQRQCDVGQAYVWMLSNLSPNERVALALHEVFDWSHEDVSKVLGRSVVNCRQLVFQARHKQRGLGSSVARLTACDRQDTENFLRALASGSVEQVVAMLAPGVVLRSDGGGKAFAARNPIVGSERTSHFLVTSARKTAVSREVIWGGAEYWLLLRKEDRLVTAMTLVESDKGIARIFAHRNPDKLTVFA